MVSRAPVVLTPMPLVPTPTDADNPDKDRLRQVGRKVRNALATNRAVQRVPSDKAEIWVVPRFFDTVECGRLMSIIDTVARPSLSYDGGDLNGFRTSYREKAIESCTAGARAAMPAGVQVDVNRVCTCAVERHMEGKSATELMGNDDQQAAQAATERCLREEMARQPGGGGAKPTG